MLFEYTQIIPHLSRELALQMLEDLACSMRTKTSRPFNLSDGEAIEIMKDLISRLESGTLPEAKGSPEGNGCEAA